ncbi:MAG: hypothetical protein ABIF71_02160 [Planctomycetota bacterium]
MDIRRALITTLCAAAGLAGQEQAPGTLTLSITDCLPMAVLYNRDVQTA